MIPPPSSEGEVRSLGVYFERKLTTRARFLSTDQVRTLGIDVSLLRMNIILATILCQCYTRSSLWNSATYLVVDLSSYAQATRAYCMATCYSRMCWDHTLIQDA